MYPVDQASFIVFFVFADYCLDVVFEHRCYVYGVFRSFEGGGFDYF